MTWYKNEEEYRIGKYDIIVAKDTLTGDYLLSVYYMGRLVYRALYPDKPTREKVKKILERKKNIIKEMIKHYRLH